MNEHAKTLLWGWSSSLVLSIVLFCVIFFSVGRLDFRGASDACFASGAVLLFAPALILIARTGVFDILFYSFYRLAESFKAGNEKRYDTAYDYKEHRKQKRSCSKPFLFPFFICGALLLFLALLFLFLDNY